MITLLKEIKVNVLKPFENKKYGHVEVERALNFKPEYQYFILYSGSVV